MPIVLLKLVVIREKVFSFVSDFIGPLVLCYIWVQSSDSWVLQGKKSLIKCSMMVSEITK